jgi:hypothetical protein
MPRGFKTGSAVTTLISTRLGKKQLVVLIVHSFLAGVIPYLNTKLGGNRVGKPWCCTLADSRDSRRLEKGSIGDIAPSALEP